MEIEIQLSLEESSLLRNALDVIQIQGKNARMVANLQGKLEEHIFQTQMNLQMAEEQKKQQLEEISKSPIKQSRGSKS